MIRRRHGLGNLMATTKRSLLNSWQTPSVVLQLLRTEIYVQYIEWSLMTVIGYESNFTANSKGTFQFNANSTMFDTTTNDDSNEEIILEGSNLNVNAAAATKKQRPPSILKGKGRKTFKSSEILAGAVSKIMTNKQFQVIDPDTKNVAG